MPAGGPDRIHIVGLLSPFMLRNVAVKFPLCVFYLGPSDFGIDLDVAQDIEHTKECCSSLLSRAEVFIDDVAQPCLQGVGGMKCLLQSTGLFTQTPVGVCMSRAPLISPCGGILGVRRRWGCTRGGRSIAAFDTAAVAAVPRCPGRQGPGP